jgi:twinkle protein
MEGTRLMDASELKRMLADRAQAVAEMLLPAGKMASHEWRAGSIAGEPGKSLGVHLRGAKAGVWSDFGTGESGDLLDLWCAVKRIPFTAAMDEARAWLGVERPKLQAEKREWKRPQKPECHQPKDRAWAYLTEDRNLPVKILQDYKIGEDDKGNIIFPFLHPDGTLALVKRRDSIDGAKPVPTEAECEPILFGWQAIPENARSIILTEGEIDAMSWAAYGHPAMSVPFGGGGGGKQKWIENEYDRLDRFEKIYLAMDMDAPGDEAAHEIASRLGTHRCVRVKMPCKDGNRCLVDGIKADAMAKALVDATWFEQVGIRSPSEYLPKLEALFWPGENEHIGFRTPYGSLGHKLLFRPAEVTIWTGDSGAGKTQILNDCIVDWIKQGARVCLSSLEMQPQQTLKRMCKQVVGTDRPTREAIGAALQYMDPGLFIYDVIGKQKLDEMLRVFSYARARYGCNMFVIDSLMRLGVAGDDYNTQESVIFRLVEWAMSSSVHLHLVAHAKKGERDRGAPAIEDIKGAMELGANAFNIISVWRDRKFEDKVAEMQQANPDEARKMLAVYGGVVMNVAKQRNGDFEGKIGLWFDQKTYRYRSKLDGESWRRDYLPADWNAA